MRVLKRGRRHFAASHHPIASGRHRGVARQELRRVHRVDLGRRLVQPVDLPVAVDVGHRDVAVDQIDVVRRRAQDPLNADGRRLERIVLASRAVDVKREAAVGARTRDDDVWQAVGIDVEKVGDVLVDRIGRAAGHCRHALVEAFVAGEVRSALRPVEVERRHVAVAERHRRERRAARGRRQIARIVLSNGGLGASRCVEAAPLYLDARQERDVVARVVRQVIPAHQIAGSAAAESLARYVYARETLCLHRLPAVAKRQRGIRARLVDQTHVVRVGRERRRGCIGDRRGVVDVLQVGHVAVLQIPKDDDVDRRRYHARSRVGVAVRVVLANEVPSKDVRWAARVCLDAADIRWVIERHPELHRRAALGLNAPGAMVG